MEILQPNKVFLDAPSANKSIKDTNTPSFIIRPTSACTTERLLAYHGTCTFFVIVYITSRVTQFVGCSKECVTVCSENGSCKSVCSGVVDKFKSFFQNLGLQIRIR